jgi:pSer/pThr/pTyr-binding forkhead associated (FHA) protein
VLQLRLIRPGEPPREVAVPRDAAIVGRAPECDVTVDDPHISKNHARILCGVVVVDLGSTNGTWVNDVRITEPTLVTTRRFRLGNGEHAVEIELRKESPPPEPGLDATMLEGRAPSHTMIERPKGAAQATPAAAAPVPASADERERATRLARELDELKKQFETKRAQASSELAEARLEAVRLNQRVASLRAEVEARAQEGDEAVQSRLLQTKVETLEQQNVALRQKVGELEAAAAKPAAGGEPSPAPPMGEFVARMQRELARLQQENKELKERARSGAGGDAGRAADANAAPLPASAMFVQLQTEVRELRRQKSALEEALTQAQAALASAPAAAPPAVTMPPESAPPPPAADAAPRASGGAALLLPTLLGDDLEAMVAPMNASLDDFLLFVSLRFLRGAEKVVAYTALEFIEVMDVRTMLPDAGVNFRGLAAGLLAKPADLALRRKLDSYMRDVRRWLVAGLGAYKTAAKDFVRDLKKSLSIDSLTADKPIPMLAKREVELWKRASARLAELTPDTIDDGLDRLARQAAQQLLEIGDVGQKRGPA